MRVVDARQTFVGIWIRRLLEGDAIEVWGGEQLRDLNYVDDAVDALLLAALSDDANGRVFNLAGETVISLHALAALMVEHAGGGRIAVHPFPDERRRIDVGDYYADATLIRDVLGWVPRVPLRDGIARTIEYYRAHLARYV
jgi:UDP-glucose 4-epimerase